MKRLKILLALFASCPMGVAIAQERAPTREDVLIKDFGVFLNWFPGRYDNDLQVYFDGELKIPEVERNGRMHSIFAPVTLPAFGPNVFYVEQYRDNDPTKIYRQRIYRFTADTTANAVKLEIFVPSDEQALATRGAFSDQAKLAGLSPANMTLHPGCEVFWRRQDNQFIGHMKSGACRVTSQRSGNTLVINDNLILTDHSIWTNDQAVDEGEAYVYGNKANVPIKLIKARPYTCWTSVLRGAKHGDRGGGQESWTFDRGWIHDQGGELAVETNERPPREFYLRLRVAEWPYGTNRPSLTLYVHEKDNPRALSYAWADEGANRVGINLRWLQASCTLAGAERTFK